MRNHPTSREEYEDACNELFTEMKLSHREICDLLFKSTKIRPEESNEDLLATYSLENIRLIYRDLQALSAKLRKPRINPPAETIPLWEYKIQESGSRVDDELTLNEFGKEGWELAAVSTVSGERFFFFKRLVRQIPVPKAQ